MRRVTLEVGVTTAGEARVAAANGADRLELCSALEVGGVTPSPGTFLDVRDTVAIPVWVLLRPRQGGFVYTDAEFATVMRDAAWFLANGAAGVVAGALTADGRIDARCADLVALAKGRAVFHRAFDFVADQPAALDDLITLGFTRVLTSGGAATAAEGRGEIAALVRQAAGRIEVLPGGGVRPENVAQLLRETGCDQVHAALRGAATDPPPTNPWLAGQMGQRTTTDAAQVRAMRGVLDRLAGG